MGSLAAVKLVTANWPAVNQSVVADKDEFPYTIRVVSEITESNGSSSMATVCGTLLR